MGAGKTWLGKQVGALTGLPFIDLDAHIAQEEGATVATLFEELGEPQFRVIEQHYLLALTATNPKLILSCGGGTPCFFDNLAFMKKNGTVIWLDPPIAFLVNRLQKEKDSRPLLKDIHAEQLESFIQSKRADRILYYSQAHVHITDAVPDPAVIIKMLQHG